MVNLYFMILFNIWIFLINVSAKLAFDFTMLYSDSIGIAIALNEFAHRITILNPGNNANFIANRSNRISLYGMYDLNLIFERVDFNIF